MPIKRSHTKRSRPKDRKQALHSRINQKRSVNGAIRLVIDRVFERLVEKFVDSQMPFNIKKYCNKTFGAIGMLGRSAQPEIIFNDKTVDVRIHEGETQRVGKDTWVRNEVPSKGSMKGFRESMLVGILKGWEFIDI